MRWTGNKNLFCFRTGSFPGLMRSRCCYRRGSTVAPVAARTASQTQWQDGRATSRLQLTFILVTTTDRLTTITEMSPGVYDVPPDIWSHFILIIWPFIPVHRVIGNALSVISHLDDVVRSLIHLTIVVRLSIPNSLPRSSTITVFSLQGSVR